MLCHKCAVKKNEDARTAFKMHVTIFEVIVPQVQQ